MAAYPAKPVRWSIAGGAGGAYDIVARALLPMIGNAMGQPQVMENRAGSSGIAGTDFIAKAAPDGYNLLFAGNTQFMFPSLFTAFPQIKGGKVKAIAVTGSERSPELPDVPSMAEAGFPDVNTKLWSGYFAPLNTPPSAPAIPLVSDPMPISPPSDPSGPAAAPVSRSSGGASIDTPASASFATSAAFRGSSNHSRTAAASTGLPCHTTRLRCPAQAQILSLTRGEHRRRVAD